MKSLTATQLKAKLDDGGKPVLLDVREQWEYDLGHISGSLHAPMPDVGQALELIDKDRETVVICHHGMRSYQVAAYLERSGFEEVFNLDGGVDAWSRDVDPQIPQY